jgi:hypothetical protein
MVLSAQGEGKKGKDKEHGNKRLVTAATGSKVEISKNRQKLRASWKKVLAGGNKSAG